MSQISILGCGWLGFPLAKKLIESDYVVKGSTTSVEKLAVLKGAGIQPFQIELSSEAILGDVADFLENSDTLIIDIPPKLRLEQSENFVSKIKLLLPFTEQSQVKKVLFISSTSVYGDTDSEILDEGSTVNPETESGKQLVETEALLQKNPHFQTTILRFGGLIGEDRHPVFRMSGKINIENPNAPINLIHQTDCIGIIAVILDQNIWNETFNAVAPFHPTREAYYTQKAIKLGLTVPNFNPEGKPSGKIISSAKVQTDLKYSFQKTTDL